MSIKDIYNKISSTLDVGQLELLDLSCSSDDYHCRIKFISSNWGKSSPELPFLMKGNIKIQNYNAILGLIKYLGEKGLLLSSKMFFHNKSIDPLYIISINKNNNDKIHLFCMDIADKEEILKHLDIFRFRLKSSKI